MDGPAGARHGRRLCRRRRRGRFHGLRTRSPPGRPEGGRLQRVAKVGGPSGIRVTISDLQGGAPAMSPGSGSERSHGWRSEADRQRAEAWRAAASVRRRGRSIPGSRKQRSNTSALPPAAQARRGHGWPCGREARQAAMLPETPRTISRPSNTVTFQARIAQTTARENVWQSLGSRNASGTPDGFAAGRRPTAARKAAACSGWQTSALPPAAQARRGHGWPCGRDQMMLGSKSSGPPASVDSPVIRRLREVSR